MGQERLLSHLRKITTGANVVFLAITHCGLEIGSRNVLVLEVALDSIGQHHPHEVIWVEAAASAG
ncbi:MAG: hypothetical protein JWP29_2681 [Rhodoferax sp.]|nr:hypothetical protein [Rhodoferax sp.]